MQESYCNSISFDHRKTFGQFFTHEVLSNFMVRWVCAGGAKRLFDPAFGLGNFADVASRICPDCVCEGFEKDPEVLTFWQEHQKEKTATVRLADYLDVWGEAHDAIVCNPPYLRFQQFPSRAEVFKNFVENLGVQLSGFTNIASAFLVKSVSELKPGGRLAYLMPIDFLNSGYGEIVKSYLMEQGALRAVLRFEQEKDIFADVLTSVGILLFEKGAVCENTRFITISDLGNLGDETLEEGISVRRESLNPELKWRSFFQMAEPQEQPVKFVHVSSYGRFLRGIATGANEFFMLSAKQKAELGIEDSEVLPCISKSRYVKSDVFLPEDFQALRERNAQVFLLNPGKTHSPGLDAYLKAGEEMGIQERYLPKSRSPWYSREPKEVAGLWVGTFSRSRFHVVRNLAGTWNLTCYHGFYPNSGMEFMLDRLFLFLLSRVGQNALCFLVRKYGNGLGKLEPSDLNGLLLPPPECLTSLSDEVVRANFAKVCKGKGLSESMEKMFEKMQKQCEK